MTDQDWRVNLRRYTDAEKAEQIAGEMANLRCAICKEPAAGYQIREGWLTGLGPEGDAFPNNLARCSGCEQWVCHDHYDANRLASLCSDCWKLELFLEGKPDTLPKAGFRELVVAGIRNRGRRPPSLEALWQTSLDGQTARFCTKCSIPIPPGHQVCPMCESAEHLRPIEL